MIHLARGARELGLSLSPAQLAQFNDYYHHLTQWNQKINLTAIAGCRETQIKHFLDSLTVCLAARQELSGPARIIDIGSGGGFPGIPLKIAFPQIELHLIDSVAKKTAFLQHLTAALNLPGVTAHTGRAETLARQPDLRDSFDLALARGVARLPLLLEYALPFCRPGGKAVALKQGDLRQELAEAQFALTQLAAQPAGLFPVTLTALPDHRRIAAFRKTAPTPQRYPRRPGIPAKRPLLAPQERPRTGDAGSKTLPENPAPPDAANNAPRGHRPPPTA